MSHFHGCWWAVGPWGSLVKMSHFHGCWWAVGPWGSRENEPFSWVLVGCRPMGVSRENEPFSWVLVGCRPMGVSGRQRRAQDDNSEAAHRRMGDTSLAGGTTVLVGTG